MIDLKKTFGAQVRVSLEESWEGGDKTHHWIIKGSRGDIMAYDDSTLEVTVYGVPLKLKPDVLPNATHNLSLPIKLEKSGWKAKNHYDDSTCFLLPVEWATKAFKIIKARKRRQVTEAMRQKGRDLAARFPSKLRKPLINDTPARQTPENGERGDPP